MNVMNHLSNMIAQKEEEAILNGSARNYDHVIKANKILKRLDFERFHIPIALSDGEKGDL